MRNSSLKHTLAEEEIKSKGLVQGSTLALLHDSPRTTKPGEASNGVYMQYPSHFTHLEMNCIIFIIQVCAIPSVHSRNYPLSLCTPCFFPFGLSLKVQLQTASNSPRHIVTYHSFPMSNDHSNCRWVFLSSSTNVLVAV